MSHIACEALDTNSVTFLGVYQLTAGFHGELCPSQYCLLGQMMVTETVRELHKPFPYKTARAIPGSCCDLTNICLPSA